MRAKVLFLLLFAFAFLSAHDTVFSYLQAEHANHHTCRISTIQATQTDHASCKIEDIHKMCHFVALECTCENGTESLHPYELIVRSDRLELDLYTFDLTRPPIYL